MLAYIQEHRLMQTCKVHINIAAVTVNVIRKHIDNTLHEGHVYNALQAHS